MFLEERKLRKLTEQIAKQPKRGSSGNVTGMGGRKSKKRTASATTHNQVIQKLMN